MTVDQDKSSREHQLRCACAQLDREIRAGRDCRAESLLMRFPLLAADEPSAVELIYTEFAACESSGRQYSCEEYYRRFPQWRAGLEEQFQVHRLLASELDDESSATATSSHAPEGDDGSGPRCRRIGPYEILEVIVRGNMGVVYRARQRGLNRVVALKMIAAGGDSSRFNTEAAAVARLQHPNIVQIYEVGDVDGCPYLALEFLSGGTLAHKLSGRPYAPHDAARLVHTLSQAVDYAHRQGVVHRDLKPANVLLTAEGVPKIADFGIARLLDRQESVTEAGEVFGTPSYMAPEQAAGRADLLGPAVDVYALGAILYELLTGRPPFLADSPLGTIHQVLSQEPVLADRAHHGVPRDLAVICAKCLKKEPHGRYADAQGLAEDLTRFLAGEPIRARASAAWERGWKWARRRPSQAALLLVSVVAAAVILVGTLLYNASLTQALGEAQRREHETEEFAAEANRQQREALRQAELLRQQFDKTRRSLYTIQLAQVEETWKTDPWQARALLEDSERCPADLRDFAWQLFHRLCSQDRVLHTGDSLADHLAFSQDGQWLFARLRDGTLAAWNLAGGDRPTIGKLPGGIASLLTVTPNRLEVVVEGNDRALVRMDLTGKVLDRAAGTHRDGPLAAAAVSPDGKWLATGDRDGNVRLHDAVTLVERARRQGHSAPVASICFSPQGTELVTSGVDETVRWWGLPSLDGRDDFAWDSQRPVGVALAQDGERLAVLENDAQSISVWDLETHLRKGTTAQISESLCSPAFSPNDRLLAAGGKDHTVRLWRADTCTEELALKGHADRVRHVVFSPDGNTLASASDDRTVRLWAIGTRYDQDVLPRHGSTIVAAAICPKGRWVAVGGTDGVVKVWDLHTREEVAAMPSRHGKIWSLSFAPKGGLLAVGCEDGAAALWSTSDWRELDALKGHRHRVWCATFSPDGALLATASEDGIAKLWEVSARRVSKTLEGGRDTPILAAGFSPDGKRLATGSYDGGVELWDVATGTRSAALKGHTQGVLLAAFSPDGQWLVTGGADSLVRTWDAQTLICRHTLVGHANNVFSAAFTSDSTTLIIGSGSRGVKLPGQVKLWDLPTGQCRATFSTQTGPIALASETGILATVQDHTAIRLWNTGSERRE